MKIRTGFVSNSSSSSFILVTKEPITEGFLEREYKSAGLWALPVIDFLVHQGSTELGGLESCCVHAGDPMEEWRRRNGVGEDEHVREYEFANWGDGVNEIQRSFWYNGYDFLETPNIRVLSGTVHG